ncbi:phage portal protein [Massilia eurypsychrophila]|uniref:Phage portal protein n=1 Tax=Massilia eurypsychrophila TaxID=1485217 RepID=A0A2G8T7I6_9BURK|nr:phage portal protein [Massilia eurypsychrophila]PIL41964.1 phage portal protein [Massilia eurypsychrophila]
MSEKTKAGSWSLKSVFFSIRDAMAYREATRDPGNRDITRNDSPGIVSIDAALQLSTVWACIRLIAETISTLPLLVYERDGEARKIARDHPLFALLHDSPNADMTAVEFWEAVVSQLCLWGNAYCLKSFGAAGRLVALDPLNPALMTVRRTLDGAITFVYADPRGRREYSEAEIWHVKGFGTDGLMGQSPISIGWRSIRGARAAEVAASDLYTNNMRPAAIVSVKEFLDKDQRARMKDKVMGAVFGNAQTGQLQLLEGGAEYEQLTMNPVDAQMLESRTFSVEDLCRWFGMPPSMIGHGTAVSNWGTGLEQKNLHLIQYVLRPYLVRIEQGVRKSLLKPAERTRFFAEYSMEGLLRGDSAARAAFYSSMTQNGLMTRNEARSLENWPRKDGGDELTVQSNLIPLSLLGKVTNSAQAAKSAVLTWLGIKEENDGLPD